MAYCVPQDVREVLTPDGSVSPGSDTAASLSDEELVQHIADASAQVDAALASAPTFYPSPLPTPPPALVIAITRDIAAYSGTLTWKKSGLLPPESPVFLRYQRAQSMLDQLASGAYVLPGYGANLDSTAFVMNIVPDQWTWWPDLGFGAGQQQPG